MLRRGRCPPQSPAPGFGEKYWSLSAFPSHSFQSGGGAFLTEIFGQIFAYSAFSDSHFSSPGSVSGLIASTGHSGTQTPQWMHSSVWLTSMFSSSQKQSTGHTSTQSMILQRIQLSLTTKVNQASFQQIAVVNSFMVSVRPRGARSFVENGRTEDLRPLAESEHPGAGIQRPRGPCSAGCRTSLCRSACSPGKHRSSDAHHSWLEWTALGAGFDASQFALSCRAN